METITWDRLKEVFYPLVCNRLEIMIDHLFRFETSALFVRYDAGVGLLPVACAVGSCRRSTNRPPLVSCIH